jgi:hypothetical protein
MTAAAANKPPLTVWIVAVVVAIAILLVFANLQRTAWLGNIYQQVDPLYLQRLQSVPPDALHIVALGSSKTKFAIDFDDALAARIVVPGRRVVFHRFTARAATLGEMQPVLDTLAQHPPAVLLVETGLLAYEHGELPLLQSELAYARQNIALLHARWIGGHVGLEQGWNRGEDSWPSASVCRQHRSQDSLRAYADYVARWRVLTDAERAAFVAALRRLHAAGTRMVLLTLPSQSTAQDVVPESLKQQQAQLRDTLVKNDGFVEWKPAALDMSFYCDLLHVNQRGHEVDSAWLARQLSALLGHSGV